MADVWEEARREFPALSRHVYLNAAAASPIPAVVRAAVETFHRQLEADGDLHWETWLAACEEARERVARLLNASPDEIAFAPNTSTGLNWIVDLLEPDGTVLSDPLEFPTVTLPWIHRGLPVRFVEPRNGILHAADFAPEVAPAATIVISHVQFSNGCRQDLAAFGRIKGSRHLVVCASQSAGAFPIDVRRDAIDALASAGHKWMCAGYGAGFAYISRALLRRAPRTIGWLSVSDPFRFDNRRYDLLPTARRHEMGCPAFGPILALGAAANFLLGLGLDAIAERVLALNSYLTDQLRAAGIEVLSPAGAHRSGQTLCRVASPARAVAFLQQRGVLVTEKPEGLRVSTHFYNNDEDVDRAVAALVAYRRTYGS